MKSLAEFDPEIFAAIKNEEARQENNLELIASENFVSPAVMAAMANVMTNKYAEGYPGKRYYEGCRFVDEAETLAINRAKELFQAEHVNVQAHSGTQANMAAYFTMLNPGDTMLGMSLSSGGHLTHGSPVNFSGRFFKVISYGVDEETETIDFNEVRELARRHKPKLIVAGASAYPRKIEFERFAEIAREVDARLMVDMAHIAGLIAAKLHPSPIQCSDFVTTTTHKTLRGPRGGLIFCKTQYAQLLDSQICPGIQGGPMMHTIAAKAVALKEALQPDFAVYQARIIENAAALAESLKERGIRLVSGGTDTHLILINLRSRGLTGKEAVLALDRAGITTNKNAIPFDPLPPATTSGLRIGTPAVTTRGMKAPEMSLIAEYMAEVLSRPTDRELIEKVRQKVMDLCRGFPLYKDYPNL